MGGCPHDGWVSPTPFCPPPPRCSSVGMDSGSSHPPPTTDTPGWGEGTGGAGGGDPPGGDPRVGTPLRRALRCFGTREVIKCPQIRMLWCRSVRQGPSRQVRGDGMGWDGIRGHVAVPWDTNPRCDTYPWNVIPGTLTHVTPLVGHPPVPPHPGTVSYSTQDTLYLHPIPRPRGGMTSHSDVTQRCHSAMLTTWAGCDARHSMGTQPARAVPLLGTRPVTPGDVTHSP